MAATLRPIDAFDYAKTFIKLMPLEQVQVRLLKDISDTIWMAAPWRWSIGVLTNVNLLSNTTDYSLGTLPSDFLYAIECYLADGQNPSRSLSIEPVLPATPVLVGGLPDKVAVVGAAGAAGTLRVFPTPGTQPTSPTKVFVTWYKKTAPSITKITANTIGQLVMDDEWFWVYEQGVLWAAYKYADDPRAGGSQLDERSGQVRFSGQYAEFQAAINYMREHEKLPIWPVKNALEPRAERK